MSGNPLAVRVDTPFHRCYRSRRNACEVGPESTVGHREKPHHAQEVEALTCELFRIAVVFVGADDADSRFRPPFPAHGVLRLVLRYAFLPHGGAHPGQPISARPPEAGKALRLPGTEGALRQQAVPTLPVRVPGPLSFRLA